MKTVISISEARKQLPAIIKSLRSAPDTVYQVTVHDEIVAEIRTSPLVKPGAAAAGLLKLRKKSDASAPSGSIRYPGTSKIISTSPRRSREFSGQESFLRHLVFLCLARSGGCKL